jgi:hypothetical protein
LLLLRCCGSGWNGLVCGAGGVWAGARGGRSRAHFARPPPVSRAPPRRPGGPRGAQHTVTRRAPRSPPPAPAAAPPRPPPCPGAARRATPPRAAAPMGWGCLPQPPAPPRSRSPRAPQPARGGGPPAVFALGSWGGARRRGCAHRAGLSSRAAPPGPDPPGPGPARHGHCIDTAARRPPRRRGPGARCPPRQGPSAGGCRQSARTASAPRVPRAPRAAPRRPQRLRRGPVAVPRRSARAGRQWGAPRSAARAPRRSELALLPGRARRGGRIDRKRPPGGRPRAATIPRRATIARDRRRAPNPHARRPRLCPASRPPPPTRSGRCIHARLGKASHGRQPQL